MQLFVRASTLNEKLPKRWRRSSLLHQALQSNLRTHRELYCTENLAWNTRKEINRTWAKYRISWFLDFHYSPQAISVDRTWNKEKSKRKVSRRVFATNRISFLNLSSDNWCRRRPFQISHGTASHFLSSIRFCTIWFNQIIHFQLCIK